MRTVRSQYANHVAITQSSHSDQSARSLSGTKRTCGGSATVASSSLNSSRSAGSVVTFARPRLAHYSRQLARALTLKSGTVRFGPW